MVMRSDEQMEQELKRADNVYKILLDGKWSLEDLTLFSRVYLQNYSFLYCLETSAVKVASTNIEAVLKSYELRSGMSYVNIYSIFQGRIKKHDKPQVKSITYASPGWIELALNVEVATQFAKVLGIYLTTPAIALTAYSGLYKVYAKLSELRKRTGNQKLKLDSEGLLIAQKLNDDLAKGLGFKSLTDLDKYTKDPEETSKLLMAHCRRVKKVAKFVEQGKASFPE